MSLVTSSFSLLLAFDEGFIVDDEFVVESTQIYFNFFVVLDSSLFLFLM